MESLVARANQRFTLDEEDTLFSSTSTYMPSHKHIKPTTTQQLPTPHKTFPETAWA